MPMRIIRECHASVLPHETVTVMEIQVTHMEYGKVTPDDLVVPFSEGMEIVDAIKGITYVADANGNPAGKIEPVVGAMADRTSSQVGTVKSESGKGMRYGLVALSLGLLISTGVLLFLRQRNRSAE